MSVARCQQEVDAREFREWIAFNDIQPWTEERDDIRAAMTPWTIASALAGKGRRPKLDDFVPKWDSKMRKQSPQHVQQTLRSYFAAHNAAVAASKGNR